jgi:hypothetical protein
MWLYGTEEAFTIVPNFLFADILAMVVSLAIMIWSIGFIHKKNGSLIFILLFICLFLVCGRIGQITFYTAAWFVSIRINKPLKWWRKVLPESIEKQVY